jgi:hypothetical protein
VALTLARIINLAASQRSLFCTLRALLPSAAHLFPTHEAPASSLRTAAIAPFRRGVPSTVFAVGSSRAQHLGDVYLLALRCAAQARSHLIDFLIVDHWERVPREW